jgi:hypothetical protein
MQTIDQLETANKCADMYTQVPIGAYSNNLNELDSLVMTIWPLVLSLVCVIGANFIIIVLVCSCCVPSGETEEELDIKGTRKNEVLVPKRNKKRKKEDSNTEQPSDEDVK